MHRPTWTPRARLDLLLWRIVYHAPQSILLHPFELFCAGLCLVSGTPLIFGAPPPTSIEALLPHWLTVIWGTELTVGGALVAVGLFRPRSKWELLGLQLLAPAAFSYAAAIITVLGSGGAVAAAIILGFALACFVRASVLKLAESILKLAARDVAEDDGG